MGCSGSMVLKRGRVNGGHGRKAACGGVRRRRRSGEVQGFILYLIKAGLLPVRFILYLIRAGLLPVRFRPPIAGAVDRWPEGEAGSV